MSDQINEMIIIVDTREQLPFDFSSINPTPQTTREYLPTGDYSLVGFETKICVERKSVNDLYCSCGKNRERFEREIVRMADFQYAAIVCEGDWQTILRDPPIFSKLNSKSLVASLLAWQQRYGVHFWPCPNRLFAEKITFRILDRYYRDEQVGVYHGN